MIWVGVPHDRLALPAALAAAVELAVAMEAEPERLFVEDVNLLRLAGLPFVREVRHTVSLEALDSPRMERALKAQAAQAREAPAAAAGVVPKYTGHSALYADRWLRKSWRRHTAWPGRAAPFRSSSLSSPRRKKPIGWSSRQPTCSKRGPASVVA